MENTRELTAGMLLEVTEKGSFSHLVMRDVLDKYDYMDARDKAFIKRLTEGTLERMIQIDYILDQFSKVPVSKMKPFVKSILRISVYQLLFMDGVPDSAVCNEAVKLAGKRGFKNLQGFVNGVLRNIARNKEGISYPDREKEIVPYFSIVYSMPRWIVEKWIRDYGADKAERILQGLLCVHPVTLKMKEIVPETEKAEWLKEICDKKVQIKEHPYLSRAYEVTETEGIKNLPGFREGIFYVQDVSSMLAVEAAGIAEGNTVIDVCAAPGGKSLYAADKLMSSGRVISRDLTEYKVSLIRDNRNRMGYKNINEQIWDACIFDETMEKTADVVIADLPCSGLGIMGKKRDIKYHVSKEGMSELVKLQKKILCTVWRYVKPGGVLLYSTCTINQEENQDMAGWFVKEFPFDPVDFEAELPIALKGEGREGMMQLFPGIHQSDGFFMAKMRRRPE